MKWNLLLCLCLFSLSARATKLIDPADLHDRDTAMLECFSSTFASVFQQKFGMDFPASEFRVSKEVSSRFESSDRSKILENPELYRGMPFYFNLEIYAHNSDCRINFYTQNYGDAGAEYNFWIHPIHESCEINKVKIDRWIKLSSGQNRFLPNPYFIYDIKNLVHDESGKLISFDETIRGRGVGNIRFLPEQMFLEDEETGIVTSIYFEPRKIRDCLLRANELSAL